MDAINMLLVLNGLYAVLMFGFIWAIRCVPRFGADEWSAGGDSGDLPRLSIIIPACNEAETIAPALESLLSQDYPELEIIAVNDRSTDKTGEILETLAKSYSRLKVLHVKELPAGWLGKVNALNEGVKRAGGEWLLFTDADVHFAPGALRRAVRYARHQGVDHLALLPKVLVKTFLLDLSVRTFGLLFLLSTLAPLVNRPGSRMPMGIGAFNLVRADAFRRTPGFEWLRLEPCDDYGLGLMVKRGGGTTRFAFAEEDLSITWYGSVGEMFRGLEKNLFGPGFGYAWWRLIGGVIGLLALVAAPPLALMKGIWTGETAMIAAAAAAFGANLLLCLAAPEEGRGKLPALFIPAGLVILALMMVRAGVKCLVNGGIDWRGTHYSMAELKRHRRVKFP